MTSSLEYPRPKEDGRFQFVVHPRGTTVHVIEGSTGTPKLRAFCGRVPTGGYWWLNGDRLFGERICRKCDREGIRRGLWE